MTLITSRSPKIFTFIRNTFQNRFPKFIDRNKEKHAQAVNENVLQKNDWDYSNIYERLEQKRDDDEVQSQENSGEAESRTRK